MHATATCDQTYIYIFGQTGHWWSIYPCFNPYLLVGQLLNWVHKTYWFVYTCIRVARLNALLLGLNINRRFTVGFWFQLTKTWVSKPPDFCKQSSLCVFTTYTSTLLAIIWNHERIVLFYLSVKCNLCNKIQKIFIYLGRLAVCIWVASFCFLKDTALSVRNCSPQTEWTAKVLQHLRDTNIE